MLTRIFHLNALSALHVGVGQAIGVVDLPIARAKATNLPIVPGSALKGVLRDEFTSVENQSTLFGPESISGDDGAYASALAFGDAHLLLLPARSLAGVVAFVTCPFVLARYAADLQRAAVASIPAVPGNVQGAQTCSDTKIKASGKTVVLEDLDLEHSNGADAWANFMAQHLYGTAEADKNWVRLFKERFAIISDDDFSFLADTATEIRARIRINDKTGVVHPGALWYEENLPAESVLWGVIAAGAARDSSKLTQDQVMSTFATAIGTDKTVQIGGKATVGRGLVRFIL
ncbi:MAG: type III-B CRISPR module RAMP protein Cmr4 [Gallionella sp.]|nr:type III-B CRISPR module RAMP protein Cmr4 [Gallionella sp.]